MLPRKGQRLFCPTFCTLQKVGKSCRRKAADGFNWIARICCLCALLQGLQNLEKLSKGKFQRPRSGKGVNLVSAKPLLRRAESRFAEPRDFPVRETACHFLRRAKSNQKARRGLRPSGLPGTIQISARYMIFSEMTGVHQVTGRAGYCNLPGYRR